MSDKLPIPFSSGSQAADWLCGNCDRCTKRETCDIYEAVDEGFHSPRLFTQDILDRMGYDHSRPHRFGWQCTEFDATGEWKAEWHWRRKWTTKALGLWLSLRRFVRRVWLFPFRIVESYQEWHGRDLCYEDGGEPILCDRKTARSLAWTLNSDLIRWQWVKPKFKKGESK